MLTGTDRNHCQDLSPGPRRQFAGERYIDSCRSGPTYTSAAPEPRSLPQHTKPHRVFRFAHTVRFCFHIVVFEANEFLQGAGSAAKEVHRKLSSVLLANSQSFSRHADVYSCSIAHLDFLTQCFHFSSTSWHLEWKQRWRRKNVANISNRHPHAV